MKTAMKVAERMRYSNPARGAQPPARHGPLQRLLEVTPPITTVRVRRYGGKRRHLPRMLSAPRPRTKRAWGSTPHRPPRDALGARPELERNHRTPHAHTS